MESRRSREIFRNRPDRPWGPPSLLYNGYRAIPMENATEGWCWSPTASGAEVKERVKPCLYYPSRSSWTVSRVNFNFTLPPLTYVFRLCDKVFKTYSTIQNNDTHRQVDVGSRNLCSRTVCFTSLTRNGRLFCTAAVTLCVTTRDIPYGRLQSKLNAFYRPMSTTHENTG